MSSKDFRGLRVAAEPIKRKINEGQSITAEELATLHTYARSNPNGNTIALYAIGKKSLVQEGEGGNE